jgi:isopenicillin-N epimerase
LIFARPGSSLRRHWTLDENVTYLNHGAFGACPRPVMEAAARVRAELERGPVRFFEQLYEPALDRARSGVGAFVGAHPEDVVFVPNTTTGVNAVLGSLALGPGDAVLTTDHGYNACKNAVAHLANRRGVEIRVVQIPLPLSGPDEVVERIVGAAGPNVRLALVDHVTSQTGLVFPIARIVAALRERGIETLVDGAHGPGMVPLDLNALGAAYYVGNFHKWVCASKGAAMLWVRRDMQRGIHPTSISHGYSSTRDRPRYLEEFDWTGSADPGAFLSVPEAIQFVGGLLPGGWPEIYARNRALVLSARSRLCGVVGTAPVAPESMIGSLAAIFMPDAPPGASPLPQSEPLHRTLADEYRIEAPVFVWPLAPKRLLRISAHLYNTEADYETAARALSLALASGRV